MSLSENSSVSRMVHGLQSWREYSAQPALEDLETRMVEVEKISDSISTQLQVATGKVQTALWIFGGVWTLSVAAMGFFLSWKFH